ncbi:MAG TPA: SMI1/KNR4 family protein, partial [Clostridia bacterium]
MILNKTVISSLKLIQLEYELLRKYVNFELFPLDQLDKEQVGYSIDNNVNSLITGEDGSWDNNWLVIGYETLCGDPIIIDLSEDGYPVTRLIHGMGSWEGGTYLSFSIDSFYNILKGLNNFIHDKCLTNGNINILYQELNLAIKDLFQADKYTSFEDWGLLLGPLIDLSKEHEDDLI